MGSSINLGLISTDKCENFISKCDIIIKLLKDVEYISLQYPCDDSYLKWHIETEIKYSTVEVLKTCYEHNMSSLKINFKICNINLKNVQVRIKHIEDKATCLLFEIPESNLFFKNIDIAEKRIMKVLKKSEKYGFSYAFCDNNANIPNTLDRLNIQERYSIFISYKPKYQVYNAPWKIDGLSSRT